jgi:hypothetical protein
MPKDKKEKKAAKADKGGIKMPKRLRKLGGKAMKLASQPAVSEIVAAALLSAATALRDNEGARKSAAKAGTAALDAAEGLGKESGKIGASLSKLAIDLARRSLDNWERAEAGSATSGGDSPSKPPKAARAKGGKAKKGSGKKGKAAASA